VTEAKISAARAMLRRDADRERRSTNADILSFTRDLHRTVARDPRA
jgi:hypothetical protein